MVATLPLHAIITFFCSMSLGAFESNYVDELLKMILFCFSKDYVVSIPQITVLAFASILCRFRRIPTISNLLWPLNCGPCDTADTLSPGRGTRNCRHCCCASSSCTGSYDACTRSRDRAENSLCPVVMV